MLLCSNRLRHETRALSQPLINPSLQRTVRVVAGTDDCWGGGGEGDKVVRKGLHAIATQVPLHSNTRHLVL